ncbi:hypothetical protein LCGC14_1238990 [marine sediment metagenome]|uniref:Uncharacterized protein n=1 Tax=marine sediment metagenome TaxID=412755 RepID=A0A0F9NNK7_9ZZZZ
MDIKKKIEISLEIKVSCRRCEKTMVNTASLTKNHLYFACSKCNNVIVIDLDIKN